MTTAPTATTDTNKVTTRRISWAELYRLRPDLKPVNDYKERKAA